MTLGLNVGLVDGDVDGVNDGLTLGVIEKQNENNKNKIINFILKSFFLLLIIS